MYLTSLPRRIEFIIGATCAFLVAITLVFLGWRVAMVGRLIDRIDEHLNVQDYEADMRLRNQVLIIDNQNKILQQANVIIEHCKRCDAHVGVGKVGQQH